MNLYIVGFMGSGKSYYGSRWAKMYGWQFYDLDVLAEQAAQLSIADIFLQKGEPYFRTLEASILRETKKYTHSIIACGGGTPCYYDNMAWMKQNGQVIFLNTSIPTIVANVQSQKHLRPLISQYYTEQLLIYVQQKLAERLPFYVQSNLTIPEAALEQAHTTIPYFFNY